MLSYRHSYHAGNHADVLKHLSLVGLLQCLIRKDKPLSYFETHAGGGRYPLASQEMNRSGEYRSGAQKIRQGESPLLRDYRQILDRCSAAKPAYYPGSPALAQMILRPQDRMDLCEWHGNEAATLRRQWPEDGRIHIHERDGFEAIKALLPPPLSRGLVLIDPSYEQKQDYQRVVDAICSIRHRYRAAVIALWYPRLPRDPAASMRQQLLGQADCDIQQWELDVQEPLGDFGMYGSGMLIWQPPWQFAETLEAALSEAAPQLSSTARWRGDCHDFAA